MVRQETDGLLANWKAVAACTLMSMFSFQYGIDFTAIGGLQAMVGFLEIYGHKDPSTPIGWNISALRQQLISSLMTLGAFIASGCAGFAAAKLSRKVCLWIACLTCAVSNIIMMATNSIGVLYFARLLMGLANGFFMTFSQLYIQECSPARYRGMLLSAFQFWTSMGALVGTIVDNFTNPLGGKKSYLIPLGIIYIIPSIVAIAMFFIPESPRWLLQHNKVDEARHALQWLRPDKDKAEVELADIRVAIEAEMATASSVSIADVWKHPVDRRRTLLSIGAVSIQAASGAMYMISYGTYFFEMAKVGNAFANSCILTAVGVFVILLNSMVISKIGRRRVFLTTGMIMCGISQLIVAAVYQSDPGSTRTGKIIIAFSVLYIVGYNGAVASYAWLSGGELPSQRLRSYTFGFSAAIGFLGAWLTTFTAPYFINAAELNWGPKYGYIWFPSCMVAALWVYLYLPEVKNRTLEEIDEMFEARLPARKFRKYVCKGRASKVAETENELAKKDTEEAVWSDEKAGAQTTTNAV